MQFDGKGGNLGVNALQIDDVPEPAYFVNIQRTGIKAMLMGILIAFLTATLSS
jgi:hypothetical protein